MGEDRNYVRQMDAIIEKLGSTCPALLLHACCGPCSSSVLEVLCAHFDVTVLYANPNIWPAEEYHRRREELRLFLEQARPGAGRFGEAPYEPEMFYDAVKGLEREPERGGRCTVCYRLRMRCAAQYAAKHGFDWFTTTLSVSPHKDAVRINTIGAELEKEYGVCFLPGEFKKRDGYKRSLELSREYGLYRQDYCGCEFSVRKESR